jgi:hypothetical protein
MDMDGVYIRAGTTGSACPPPAPPGRRYSFKATVTSGGVVETPVYNIVCRRGAY